MIAIAAAPDAIMTVLYSSTGAVCLVIREKRSDEGSRHAERDGTN
jgi:hypothetical protein